MKLLEIVGHVGVFVRFDRIGQVEPIVEIGERIVEETEREALRFDGEK